MPKRKTKKWTTHKVTDSATGITTYRNICVGWLMNEVIDSHTTLTQISEPTPNKCNACGHITDNPPLLLHPYTYTQYHTVCTNCLQDLQ